MELEHTLLWQLFHVPVDLEVWQVLVHKPRQLATVNSILCTYSEQREVVMEGVNNANESQGKW